MAGATLPGFARADALVGQAGRAHDERRPYGSGGFLTPSRAREQEGPLVRRWKNYYQPAAISAPTGPTAQAAKISLVRIFVSL